MRAMGCEPMLASAESSRASMKSSSVIGAVAIDEDPAVGYVGVMVEKNAVVVPIVSPVVPPPAKSSEEADSKAQAKLDARTFKEQSWIPVPSWPNSDRRSVYKPRIILGNVNHLRSSWLDHNVFALLAHLFLRCAL